MIPVRGRMPRLESFAVVGIGASAGGLKACTTLMGAVPTGSGLAFILIQHLDPTHESMMVDLLARHTSVAVRQAEDGMLLERDSLYVIPPGAYLSVNDGALRLSKPTVSHGARLPFDFLLHSLAENYGERARCVVLSGTGADGSLGLQAVKAKGGLVIVQDPTEAGYDGMPRSAIMTGAVDLVLPAAKISEALIASHHQVALSGTQCGLVPKDLANDWLPDIIELLRTRTSHDFGLYKRGTLQRRIERRMTLATIRDGEMGQYLDMLRDDQSELEQLANDLLINVTGFFRDRKVFDVLERRVIPDLVRGRMPDRPLRIWCVGCSTGEETYSLAMLLRERIAEEHGQVRLQVFASDVNPDAIASAREGLYPETIEGDVSPERLTRFFLKDDHGYRVKPDLRAAVVFTVQDVLADPPFSLLDLVSCRNLLIYLGPEAQAQVISRFHFALRQNGILLLGSAETPGSADGRFEVISKAERLFRRIGHDRPEESGTPTRTDGGGQGCLTSRPSREALRQTAFAELGRRLVLETYAPAAVLIDRNHECLFSIGPTDRYLRVAPGQPTHNLLAMARPGLRATLKSAIQQSNQEKRQVVVSVGYETDHDGFAEPFSIDVRPVLSDGEELLLVCFVEAQTQVRPRSAPVPTRRMPRTAELKRELDARRAELQGAIRDLEALNEEQKATNEEALSVNEEYQSTNEELLTSKEELQSLNEELTALNSQLQETLEQQRTTSDDLQNILYSTDVATLFLDPQLNIRFFTPATKSLFNVIPGDIGRPLEDLRSLAADTDLSDDARTVLRSSVPLEREIETPAGVWFRRRILPYLTHDGGVEGVVITFNDITKRKHAATVLEMAKQQLELANVAKSRFLAIASHDLRQPLQTLALLQGLLVKAVEGKKAQGLVAKLDDILGAISGMLNMLLDINQIEAGVVRAEMVDFEINGMLERLKNEFTYHAYGKGLVLHVVPCGRSIRSDPRLLEQMVRNLLSNALKYTKRGKVLVGCRQHPGMLSIEVWDTGVGIPNEELQTIFEEYHQLDNAHRERNRGLGLGLSIVERLGKLLDHRVRVRSCPGKGSVFAIEIALAAGGLAPHPVQARADIDNLTLATDHHTGAILVVEDDPETRELLKLSLTDEGHRAATAPDGLAALDLVAQGTIRPDLVLVDYSLPNGLNGLQFAAQLRKRLDWEIPVIVLTGDISINILRDVALQNCVQLNKPVKLKELTALIQRLLPVSPIIVGPRALNLAEAAPDAGRPTVFIVDDDANVREAICALLEEDGRIARAYSTCETFLEAYCLGGEACLLVDAYLPGMDGLELLQRLREAGHRLPAIMITGQSDVPMAVQAMKAGASDFIEKPIGRVELLASIDRIFEQSRDTGKLSAGREDAVKRLDSLTRRQHQIMELVLVGHPSKNIAADLGISQRTVESHRAAIMEKTGSTSLPALARLALAVTWDAANVQFGRGDLPAKIVLPLTRHKLPETHEDLARPNSAETETAQNKVPTAKNTS